MADNGNDSSASVRMNARVAFKLFDTDGSGDIDENEVKSALEVLEMPSTDQDVATFMKEAGCSGSSKLITMQQFEEYYAKSLPDPGDLWQIFDKNGNGFIEKSDVFAVAKLLNEEDSDKFSFDEQQIFTMFQTARRHFGDSDAETGGLTRDQFNVLKETNWDITTCKEGDTQLACYRFQLLMYTSQTVLQGKGGKGKGMFNLISALMRRRVQDFVYADPKTGKLPWRVKFAFAMPTMSTVPVMAVYVTIFLTPYYSSMQMPFSTMAFIMAFGRCVDVMSDPTMSYITDTWRRCLCLGNMGRRRPFIIFGGPVFAFCLTCLWSPPWSDWDDGANLGAWFAIFYISYYLCATLITIPYDSLGPELSDDYLERNSLFSLCNVFDGVGSVLCIALPMGIKMVLQGNHAQNEAYHLVNSRRQSVPDQHLYVGPDAQCDPYCKVMTMKTANTITALFFGIWYVVSGCLLCFLVKERSQHAEKAAETKPEEDEEEEPIPAVVNLMSVLDNKPFVSLLPAWCLDTLGQAIVQALLPFYVAGVVVPESQRSRLQAAGMASFADTDNVVRFAGAIMCIGGAMSLPVWLFFATRLGKRRTWLLWSFWGGCTNILLFLINKGDVEFFLAVSFINGTPLGARFLADTILSDIIDYDEFLSGRRSEATFLMFKSFLPKMVGLPAAVLPIAFLPLVGYNTESAAIGEDQPASAMWYLKLLSGPVSTLFCVASFVVKLRFPLKTEQQVNAIGLGVALHVAGKSAPDPLSNNDPPQLYSLVDIQSKKEQHLANIINHFPGPGVIRRMLGLNEDGTPVNDRLKFETTRQDEVHNQAKKVVKQVIYLVCIMLLFAFLAFFLSLGPPNLLESTNWSWICTVLMIIFGLSLVFTLGAALRRGASKKLAAEHSEMTEDFLKRLLENRQALINAGKKELGLSGTNATKERKAKIRADNRA